MVRLCRRAKEMFAASYPDTPVHLVVGATPQHRAAAAQDQEGGGRVVQTKTRGDKATSSHIIKE
jgi:hypothetical protein